MSFVYYGYHTFHPHQKIPLRDLPERDFLITFLEDATFSNGPFLKSLSLPYLRIP